MNDKGSITPVEKEVRHTKHIGDNGRGNNSIMKIKEVRRGNC
jgi:hypothetical protein